MGFKKLVKVVLFLTVPGLIIAFGAKKSLAIPSFARQTGLACSSCHTIFPELKPLGRLFKLTGYTMNMKGAKCPSTPPVAGRVQFSFTHTDAAQPFGSLPANGWALHNASAGNDVIGTPEWVSVYYGGQVYGHLGAFIQASWMNNSTLVGMDMTDIRYANQTSVCGKNLIFGAYVGNNPTLEDVWNTTPAYGFPYVTSDVAPSPGPDVLMDMLMQQVGGGGIYGFWDNTVYACFGVYRTALNGITSPFAAGDHPLMVYTNGPIPYWRIFLTRQYGPNTFEIGTYGLSADTFVAGTSGATDNFLDYDIDSEYQYINGNHAVTLAAHWIHEDEDRSGSFLEGAASNTSDHLNVLKVNGEYYYTTKCGIFGGIVQYFTTTGNNDALLYADDPNGNPDSNGEILQLDYMPSWHNFGPGGFGFAKFFLQYIIYNKFNGTSSGASDNNTLYLAAVFMF